MGWPLEYWAIRHPDRGWLCTLAFAWPHDFVFCACNKHATTTSRDHGMCWIMLLCESKSATYVCGWAWLMGFVLIHFSSKLGSLPASCRTSPPFEQQLIQGSSTGKPCQVAGGKSPAFSGHECANDHALGRRASANRWSVLKSPK